MGQAGRHVPAWSPGAADPRRWCRSLQRTYPPQRQCIPAVIGARKQLMGRQSRRSQDVQRTPRLVGNQTPTPTHDISNKVVAVVSSCLKRTVGVEAAIGLNPIALPCLQAWTHKSPRTVWPDELTAQSTLDIHPCLIQLVTVFTWLHCQERPDALVGVGHNVRVGQNDA